MHSIGVPLKSTHQQIRTSKVRFLTFIYHGLIMDKSNFFNDLQSRINQVRQSSPAKDREKNMKAMLNQGFSRLDLVTREDFDVQAQVLARTRERLEALEAKVAGLEALLKQ